MVEGLRNGDARAPLGSVLRAPLDERVRDRIIAETRGNPLALLELPRGLTPAELAGGFGLPDAPGLSGRIEDSFRRRLAGLSAETQRLLLVAAAEPVGDPVLLWRGPSGWGSGSKRPTRPTGCSRSVHGDVSSPVGALVRVSRGLSFGEAGCASRARGRDRRGRRSRSTCLASRRSSPRDPMKMSPSSLSVRPVGLRPEVDWRRPPRSWSGRQR